eukprot:TRINITY_DN75892_c0_g1_i1.p1 TRINITY_DN75892_c0_g1~~TRINITY_DN75892_c0_g1_i1.p1  ORF type:complete len:1229 (-),score=245.25 TRINITY_DN75892_c0_g1_i1:151-3837(-)
MAQEAQQQGGNAASFEQRVVELLGQEPFEISTELGLAASSSSSLSLPGEQAAKPSLEGCDVQIVPCKGQLGLVLAWVTRLGIYLVETFDGDVLRVQKERLQCAPHVSPVDGGFDIAFSRFSQRMDIFQGELADTLQNRHYSVVQLCSRPAERRSLAEMIRQTASWHGELPEFESDIMGRRFTKNKVAWLEDDNSFSKISEEMVHLANAVSAVTPRLGFMGRGRTRIMAHGASSEEDQKQLAVPGQGVPVAAVQLQERLAFREQRKLCIMSFIGASGGKLTLQRTGESVDISCQENQAVIFRHDLFDYSFDPAPDQFALQTWLLRDPFHGEVSLTDSAVAELASEELKKIPAGPLYGDCNETVDVISVSLRDPGMVNGPEDYWAMLSGGGDVVIKVPLTRWDLDLYYSEDTNELGKGYVRHFGLLSNEQMTMFDNEFFDIAYDQAKEIDPTQRNILEVGYDCLFRGGWTKQSLKGVEMASCWGYALSEFVNNTQLTGQRGFFPEMSVQSTSAAAASRMHYVFGMRGPVATTETACSSSLSAVCLTHVNLRPVMPDQKGNMAALRKQVKYGMASGSNGHFDPFYTIALCGASMLSHNGRCFTFDQSADGFIRGEGCGFMCMRVSDREDVSRLAILCGSCMNQDGRSASLTAPHGPSQQECIRHSLREGNIKPLDIQIQELHGTGTALGDPIEVGALRATMMKFEGVTRAHPLVKTSSKSNLGHTEMCAGINGLIKCVLMGANAVSAPNLHLRLLNPHIDDAAYPVYFNSEFVDQGKETGFLGVSSFGFGGSNARGDIWTRALAGPWNTSPSKERLSYGPDRIHRAIETFGKLTMPLPGVKCFEEEHGDSMEGFSGEYTVGSQLQGKMQYFVKSSANGWSYGKMTWDAASKSYSYAIMLGEAMKEQFQISCDGFDDLKIFPASQLAGQEARVLGPGTAPAGHTWMIDGCTDKVKPGTVYKITMSWDGETRRKRIMWEPVETSNLQLQVVRHSYYMVASWTSYRPFEMQAVRKGELYESVIRIGLSGCEEFQFMRDADTLQAIYPAEKGGYSSSVPVRGPDPLGAGKYWRIDGVTGESFTIQLEIRLTGIFVSATSPRGKRHWSSMSARRYFVTGSWNRGAFSRMIPDSGSGHGIHRLVMMMSSRGEETFQIVADQDLAQAIHPEMALCDQLTSHTLGPDSKGEGLHWCVVADPGEAIEITLDLSELGEGAADARRAVTWQVLPSIRDDLSR